MNIVNGDRAVLVVLVIMVLEIVVAMVLGMVVAVLVMGVEQY